MSKLRNCYNIEALGGLYESKAIISSIVRTSTASSTPFAFTIRIIITSHSSLQKNISFFNVFNVGGASSIGSQL